MQPLLSPKALAALLGLAMQTIYNRRSTGGDLPKAVKVGHLVRFRAADVDAWLDAKGRTLMFTRPLRTPGQSSPPHQRRRLSKATQLSDRSPR
ncbi:prophage regulatory protein [Burkholderia latens]|uniref:helix-turn-helix transcriptional regulator n=1 Tax=Burkholderia latens TaxID=488446 RepID=UPI0039A668C5